MSGLADKFFGLAASAADGGGGGGAIPHEVSEEAERLLAAGLAEGRGRAEIDVDAYLAHVLAVCHKADRKGEMLATVRGLALGDLAFATACASGDARAIAAFERELVDAVPKALVRLKPDARFVDEVRQELRQKLLVGAPGQPPKIMEYEGRGPLAAWVRVVAMRIAYTHHRDAAKTTSDDVDAFERLADGADAPDVAHLKAHYAVEVRAAFEEAVLALPVEARSVLRASAVEGMTIDQIGAVYQVHRATAARWLSHARTTLLDGLRAALQRRLGVERAACDSIVALVRSRIDLSMSRVLGPG
ncbi:MAG: putative DNA-binding regulatory protein [Labilithrix sp.]|nr:putative DNA-binding regulatory protein [Labilithrix sp.]